MSPVIVALVAAFGGTMLAGLGCAAVAGALDVRRRDLAGLGIATAAIGLVGAGAGLVAPWIPAARATLVVALGMAVVATCAGFALGREREGRTAPAHARLLLVASGVCEVLLAVGAWFAAK